MSNIVHAFLEKNFQGLILRPALFYSWKSSIRFEISNPFIAFSEKENLLQIFNRTTTLFEKIFDDEDEILFITDVHTSKNNPFLHKKPLNVYLKYVKQKEKLHKLQYSLLPSVFEDEAEEWACVQDVTHRFVLQCKKNEIKYLQLLKAISYEDFAHPSTILKNNPESGYDIYFINLTKKVIYHLYDDRGCDILAADKETIRFLYDQYNDWILDYDREEIDILFN
ncbi:DUF3885 domain-containing protein [Paenisporosarcina quisquiliarum]|uniref:DUF3885 domain-containing protein n=1 Tax=Paenisporosarcina quisquiliarum TaxID=365346 RepID=UPI003736D913